jgi:hypothetical protein
MYILGKNWLESPLHMSHIFYYSKDYVYFGQKLVAEPTSHEPHFILFNIVSIKLFYNTIGGAHYFT